MQLVKLQPTTLTLKDSFAGKLTQKIIKFIRISQRTETVIVNVKHKFHLEPR